MLGKTYPSYYPEGIKQR